MEESDGVCSTQTAAGSDTAEGTQNNTVLVQMEEEERDIRLAESITTEERSKRHQFTSRVIAAEVRQGSWKQQLRGERVQVGHTTVRGVQGGALWQR
jgi:hypothetical protein